MPARSFVGSRTWVDALLILSAFKAVKPSPEKMEAGLSPFSSNTLLRPRNRYRCRIDTDAVSYPPLRIHVCVFRGLLGLFAGETTHQHD